jgi:hypothetical protein
VEDCNGYRLCFGQEIEEHRKARNPSEESDMSKEAVPEYYPAHEPTPVRGCGGNSHRRSSCPCPTFANPCRHSNVFRACGSHSLRQLRNLPPPW